MSEDMKEQIWVEETGGWSAHLRDVAGSLWVELRKGTCKMILGGPRQRVPVGCEDTEGYRLHIRNPDLGSEACCFTIQKLVKTTTAPPELKWTEETIAATNWKEKTPVEVLEACEERWLEVVEHFKYIMRQNRSGSDGGAFGTSACPACAACYDGACPLATDDCCKGGANCCDGYYDEFTRDKCIEKARVVLHFIQERLEEKRRKGWSWTPALGDKVIFCEPLESFGWVVVGVSTGASLIFDPSCTNGHNGGGFTCTKGGPVPGFPLSHRYVTNDRIRYA